MAKHRYTGFRQPRRRRTTRLGLENLESRHLLVVTPLVISEFMASNDDTLLDGDGNSSDWVEVHNPTSESIRLDGYFLSDDPDRPNKWGFPDVPIRADEYLLIFASGQSNENYVDADGNLHTNFKLDKDGEYLALTHMDSEFNITVASEFAPEFPPQFEDVSYGSGISVATETLVESGATSHFLVPPNDAVDDSWTQVEFDDASWSVGPMGVGYEDSPADYANLLQSHVPLGTDSAYVRIPFDLQQASELDSLTLRVRYDDGFIAYLNGEPLPGVRRNAPANPDYQSIATGNHPDADAVKSVDFEITSQLGLLRDGANVLAIHSLNQASSSDMLIMAELLASRPSSLANVARAYFTDPTPGQSNSTGIANPGPILRKVTQNPGALSTNDDLVITADVTEWAAPISQVKLHYRVDFGNENTLIMADDGGDADQTANDGVFSAVIPAATAGLRDMLRWYVTASDTTGANSREPAFLDSSGNGQSPEYYGTVIADSMDTALPVFQWFTDNESASHTRAGARASVFYAGRFYDNVLVRRRGGATNSSQSQKFDFNRENGLFVSEEMGTVGEININGNGSDPSYLRQSMGFDAHTAAGGAASDSFLTSMYVNGRFDRVGVWIEQVDGNFLERHGYDRGGDLYKLVQRSNLQPAIGDIATGVEKKTGDESDLSSFAALVRGVERRTESERQAFLRDHLDMAQVINYMAIRSLQHQADDVRKNFYLYNDVEGDGLWRIYPWDLDWTFNIVGGHDNQDSQRTEHPFWGVQAWPTADGANQWNKLYEALFETVEVQEMFLRRLRTLMDEFYGSRTGATTWFADYVNAHFPDIDPHLGSSVTSGKNSLLNSIQDRRRELYSVYTQNIPGYSVVIPDQQSEQPQINFGTLDFDPESGNQDQEYLELTNPNAFAVDISGWKLAGGVSHVFLPGTVIAAGGSLYVTSSVADFRQRSAGPRGGQSLFLQAWNSGHLANFSEPVALQSASGTTVDTLAYESQPTPNQLHLRITEVYYNPEPGSNDQLGSEQRFEFVELMNVSTTETLDLAGVYFSTGVDFEFPKNEPLLLAPGEIIVIAADVDAFYERFEELEFGPVNVVGGFQNGTALSNSGERIKLEDADGNTILEFTYEDRAPWSTRADGNGASLAIIDWAENREASADYGDPDNWSDGTPSPGELVFVDAVDFPGDANRDGVVTFADFLILSANFGKEAQTFEQGDFDENGNVDFTDFLILSGNFGKRR